MQNKFKYNAKTLALKTYLILKSLENNKSAASEATT